ncbi:MAG: UDP-N-acetylmuramoyl-tripeptide--D-alanyl-D-alanine ligase [Bacteroidetes bacterium]|nr:UDP-N-acetylmuramoyl-tripeptide--D-alanyl-D-alanine ligase [Bacteroidota bacterium]
MEIHELYEIFLASAGICTDTRKLAPNQLFIALKGPNFNANQLAQQALDGGACYAIIDDANFKTNSKMILVEDGLQTLQELANHHRNQLKATIIAVGGSNGKTTTKELISRVLASTYNTFYTPGNFNNHIGVPLSLLMMTDEHEFGVIEVGANHAGEHEILMEILEPNFGLITNNGKDHLEGFGSIEGVVVANAEIYHHLEENLKPAFVNGNDHLLMQNAEGMMRLVYSAGQEKPRETLAHVPIQEAQIFPLVKANIHFSNGASTVVHSHLFGSFQLTNIAVAAAIGYYFDVPIENISASISAYKPQNNRTQIVQWKNCDVVLDAYNANPSSLGAMINDFMQYDRPQKVLIMGDMLELGEHSFAEHNSICQLANQGNFEQVICIGRCFLEHKSEFDFQFFETRDEAALFLEKTLKPMSTLLIKGSRGLALEKLLES